MNEETENQAQECRNCGSPDVQQWCPICGQEDVPSALPVREILMGFLDEFLKFDTRIWVTLKALAIQPGFLTNEYLIGRRVRYSAPIKLYLSLSFIAFLAFTLFPGTAKKSEDAGNPLGFARGMSLINTLQATPEPTPSPSPTPSPDPRAPEATPSPSPSPAPTPDPNETPEEKQDAAEQKHADACSDVATQVAVKEKVRRDEVRRDAWVSANRTTLNLLRIPLYALMLAFLFRKDTKRLYVEHLVFALHYQCFDQLRDLVATVLGSVPFFGRLFEFGLIVYGLAYFVLAAQKVYALPLKRLIGLGIGFLFLATGAVWLTGITAGIVYRLTS
jgi:hypothetical protein